MPILIVWSGIVLKLKEQVPPPPVISQVQVFMLNKYGDAQAYTELHPHEQSEFWVIDAVQIVGHSQAQVEGLIVFPSAAHAEVVESRHEP